MPSARWSRKLTLAAALLLTAGAATGSADAPFQTVFDGKGEGWKTNTGKPLPAANVQSDGINPHRSGGYIVVYDKPVKDFVLEFEYKLTKGCNSGVFIRVGDLKDPVNTGIEVALDDTTERGMHDSGALYDLVPPRVNAQKPAGEWNLMSVSAKGNFLEIILNGETVSKLGLDEWDKPGMRPDGTSHKFKNVAFNTFNRPGYFGFQDHGGDCWFRNVRLKNLDAPNP